VQEELTHALRGAIAAAVVAGALPEIAPPEAILLEVPRDRAHGDWATNLAMQLAPVARMAPRKIAEAIRDHLALPAGEVEEVAIAGPGFLNFRLSRGHWHRRLQAIHDAGAQFGRLADGHRGRVLVEFVSANPTGPMHIGHGRGAVVGDVLAHLLAARGFDVAREYYVNDAGNQVRTLGRSIWIRLRQACGAEVALPDDHYPGDYVGEMAAAWRVMHGDDLASATEEDALASLVPFGVEQMLVRIRADLDTLAIHFDRWFSEKDLVASGAVPTRLAELEAAGQVSVTDDGARLLRTADHGDDKDRVVIKRDGELTYFATDIAYHADKLARGYDRLIDIWGADHHGYIARVKAAIAMLGADPARLDVLLVQIVNLSRDGVPVKMGKRSGAFVSLAEVVEEVGADATRFFFLQRRCDSMLDFDLELAKRQSNDNPVYYVQYAHARVRSLFKLAEERGYRLPDGAAPVALLIEPEEIELIQRMDSFPAVLEGAAVAGEPHRLVPYLTELAGACHAYYFKHRILGDAPDLACARLYLMETVRRVVADGLDLLGVSAPDAM
jgi:arginyl-tRNA synthetase